MCLRVCVFCLGFVDGFLEEDVKCVAWPFLCEYYPHWMENNVVEFSELREFAEDELPRDVVLDNVCEGWWSETFCADFGRVRKVIEWLMTTPLTRVGIVAHWGFIRQFLNGCDFHDSIAIDNCQPIKLQLDKVVPEFENQFLIRIVPTKKGNRDNELLNELFSFYEDCQGDSTLQTTTFLGIIIQS